VNHRAFTDVDVDLVASLMSKKQMLDARNAVDRSAWQARGFDVHVLGTAIRNRVHAQ
jgi:hypothetical protein